MVRGAGNPRYQSKFVGTQELACCTREQQESERSCEGACLQPPVIPPKAGRFPLSPGIILSPRRAFRQSGDLARRLDILTGHSPQSGNASERAGAHPSYMGRFRAARKTRLVCLSSGDHRHATHVATARINKPDHSNHGFSATNTEHYSLQGGRSSCIRIPGSAVVLPLDFDLDDGVKAVGGYQR